MTEPVRRRLSVVRRWRLVVVSGLAFCVTLACSLFRGRDSDGDAGVICYAEAPPTETPQIMCYEPVMIEEPTATPTPISPLSPLPTPVMCYTPTPSPTPTATPTPEARDVLLDRLLADGRFPETVARALQE